MIPQDVFDQWRQMHHKPVQVVQVKKAKRITRKEAILPATCGQPQRPKSGSMLHESEWELTLWVI